ncbi:MAG: hypothetical protein QM500_09740 [Methylococcales bacterium]
MSKRDIIQEILAKKDSTNSNSRLTTFINREKSLNDSFIFLLEHENDTSLTLNKELSRYYPIALASIVEGYFRAAIVDLINLGLPYSERAGNLVKDLKIQISVFAKMQSKKITLGEYVSHHINISSLDDVNSSMTCLLDMKFIEHLTTAVFDVFDQEEPITLNDTKKEFILAIKDLFKIRHKLCHEFAEDISIDNSEYLRFAIAVKSLIGLTEFILWAEESKEQKDIKIRI